MLTGLPHIIFDFNLIYFIILSSVPTVNEGLSRSVLAEPVDNRLFFAGEATHMAPGMTHTAIDTGARAAGEVLASLGVQHHPYDVWI